MTVYDKNRYKYFQYFVLDNFLFPGGEIEFARREMLQYFLPSGQPTQDPHQTVQSDESVTLWHHCDTVQREEW